MTAALPAHDTTRFGKRGDFALAQYPVFIAAAHNKHVPKKIDVPFVVVDSSCIVPMSRHEKRAYGAYTIRPKIRRELPTYLKPLESVALNKGVAR